MAGRGIGSSVRARIGGFPLVPAAGTLQTGGGRNHAIPESTRIAIDALPESTSPDRRDTRKHELFRDGIPDSTNQERRPAADSVSIVIESLGGGPK